MINQGENVNTISKILFKTFARHCETFSKFFATSLEFVEFIWTWKKPTLLFWLGQIMGYALLCFNAIWLYTDFGEIEFW